MRYDALAAVFLIIGVLVFLHRRNRAKTKAERLQMFDECLPLFETREVTQEGIYYPILRGRYKGYDVTLEPIADHIGFRTLPSLWLLTTVRGRTPFDGVLDFLRRPKNVEFYSPASHLERAVTIPPDWPQDAWLRTNNPEKMPPRELLDPHMSIFQDPRTKELLVTPNGVRIVYQAKEATRSYYMLLRQTQFEDIDMEADLIQAILDRAVAIYEDLQKGYSRIGEKGKKQKKLKRSSNKSNTPVKPPLSPYLVLGVAMILPGVGQVLNNTPRRGLFLIFFMIVGAWICYNTTTPDISFLGRYAGGWFVYAMSILDAYRWARYRYEYFKVHGPEDPAAKEDIPRI